MRMTDFLPRILVIDDMFGRQIAGRPNRDRASLCAMYGLRDVTGDGAYPADEEVVAPIGEVVFFRGQSPARAIVGDIVENDLDATLEFVRRGWQPGAVANPPWALVLLDLCFYTGDVTVASDRDAPGMPRGRAADDSPDQYFGLRVLERLHAEWPDLPVIILSSKQRDDVSRTFTAHGALGFIARAESSSPAKLREYLWRHGLIPDGAGEMLGQTREVLLALRAARRAAAEPRNILIRGERGSGKELLAEYINRCAAQAKKRRPLVIIDAGTLAPALYASELFGHVKGAYTGADHDRSGRILQGDGGDVFLDEIGNMPLDVQAGLLRVLETRMVIPVGSSSGRKIDARFIAATNNDVELRAAAGGDFRADLLDRLREGGTIVLPPLRARRDDIPLLAERFVRQAEADRENTMRRAIAPESMEKLLSYDWPGNVRELRNCILRAVSDHPDVEHLVPAHLVFTRGTPGPSQGNAPSTPRAAWAAAPPPPARVRLSELVSLLEHAEIDPQETPSWAGLWPDLQSGYGRVAIMLLRASLLATRRLSPQSPLGDVKIHPAIKLLTGDSSISTTKAADMLKRIYAGLPEALRTEFLADPILKAGLDTATRLRPRRQPRSPAPVPAQRREK